MKYKILIAGLGSIGKRHVQNISAFLKMRGDEFRFDAVRSSNSNLDGKTAALINNIYDYKGVKDKDYDMLFITNPTFRHYDTLKQFMPSVRHVFIEKPVFDNVEYDMEAFGMRPEKVCYVACPLRYNAVLQYVRKHINCESAIAVRSISSSYLPDWRLGQDYRKSYSAHKNMGGGVAIDLIHEWDYLSWLFGRPETVYCIKGIFSGLEIDSEDLAIYVAQRQNFSYELHLDYFGRKTIRELQIFMPEETVEADIANGQVRFLRSGKTINCKEDRNEYQAREIEHFFDIVEGRCENDNSIEWAMETMRLAEGKI